MTSAHIIKVMTFNIRNGLANDGENHWDNRKAFSIARIKAFEPDLLGMQECRDDAQAEYVRSHLPAYQFYGIRREGGGDTALEMAPLFFTKSTFSVVGQGHFWLSETPQVSGSKSWDAAFARTVSWVRLVHQPTDRVVTFANTHFDYNPAAISASAQHLRKWLDDIQKDSPIILTGDFNADKHSSAYQLLTGSGHLRDAYRQAHPISDDETTFHDYGRLKEKAPIDWILVSRQFHVVEAQIDRSRAGNLFPSDHYPVTTVLRWSD
jgi:endonuclease/exonuclease/phosphatase family metal-dependent hydrolase